ncbi:MAG: hypothetical protein F6K22_23040 [Okeania sp. SIO2F4]|uniref:hypothetical protein n=1 Tax=Okeania sp. SIO2F4 TaxID=2607790 RepID=UPI0014298022|nr:hypothetical protein [Okeania sp. SIO2F4]NES05436.1 hypothetical protein [Okeania sp. SIO2F4]
MGTSNNIWSLSERVFNCSNCGFNFDKDLNARRESSYGGQLCRGSLWTGECRHCQDEAEIEIDNKSDNSIFYRFS